MKKTDDRPKIWLALPLMDELDNLPALIADLNAQTYTDFTVCCCVNQPDAWWVDEAKRPVCVNNQACLHFLEANSSYLLLDHCSKGHGWKGKKYGVGWARKTVMDHCASMASPGDVIVSIDGDTHIDPDYLASIADNLGSHPKVTALSIPYSHPLPGNESADRAILRYEIYMRYYVLNLWRIGSPYSYTALGSAMAVPVWAYRAIGGMTPNKSGEDFYFLQKLRKFGEMLYWNPETVFPAARFSDRVFFGTGPAMIKGAAGDWTSYPFYDISEFDLIKETYDLFPVLFKQSISTPMDNFLAEVFKEEDPWKPLRENNPGEKRFLRACHEKIDGLRILQFLKSRHQAAQATDEDILRTYLVKYYPETSKFLSFPFSVRRFQDATVNEMNQLRDFLRNVENDFQKQHYLHNTI